MTKAEAEAYIANDYKDTEPSDSSSQASDSDTVSAETTVPVSVDETNSNSSETVGAESTETTSSTEKVETVEPERKKSRYTKEEKTRHAFMKEKQRRRDLQSRISAQEDEIKRLTEKLEKYKDLKKEHFEDNEDAYLDYKIDRRYDQERIKALQDDISKSRDEQAMELAQERVLRNFETEEERNQYQSLLTKAETDFRSIHPELGVNRFSELLTGEKDQSVLRYLQDSDNAPKLIRHFIHKPDALLKIQQMTNPLSKFLELKQLENRMLIHERTSKARTANLTVRKDKALPNTGKVAVNPTSTFDSSKQNLSKKEAEAWIRSHS